MAYQTRDVLRATEEGLSVSQSSTSEIGQLSIPTSFNKSTYDNFTAWEGGIDKGMTAVLFALLGSAERLGVLRELFPCSV